MIRATDTMLNILPILRENLRQPLTVAEIINEGHQLSRDAVNNALRSLMREEIIERSVAAPYRYSLRLDLNDEKNQQVQELLAAAPERMHAQSDFVDAHKVGAPIEVEIEVTDSQVVIETISGARLAGVVTMIDPKIVAWIAANIEGDWRTLHSPLRLAFKDPADAALYKLVWG